MDLNIPLRPEYGSHVARRCIGNVWSSSPRRDSESAGADRDLELAERRFWADARIFCKELIFRVGFLARKLFFDYRFFQPVFDFGSLIEGGSECWVRPIR